MTTKSPGRRTAAITPLALIGTLLLTGCALIQIPPVPRLGPPPMPHLGLRAGGTGASCIGAISRAHAALADAGAAAGDPSAIAAALAAHAAAMSEYHACLASDGRP